MEILPTILCDKKTREPFLAYADKILRAAAKRYSNADRDRAAEEQIIISGIDPTPNSRHIEPPTQVGMPRQKIESILSMGESGIPGLRTKSVALYMDTPYEKLGISFCSNTGPNSVSIAPGLASIIKGNSGRTAMRRKKLEAIGEVEVGNHKCRSSSLSEPESDPSSFSEPPARSSSSSS
ncbi:unnamed protein product [Danaus chrysippus]|uniref:(African queen) hypothetical protein n=1 Tax=Danaus chrysippus TaxID=151541 RepID=A0A8J2QYR5_9NEOP|nr:unnamed protein product [Danaus chrysippus]